MGFRTNDDIFPYVRVPSSPTIRLHNGRSQGLCLILRPVTFSLLLIFLCHAVGGPGTIPGGPNQGAR